MVMDLGRPARSGSSANRISTDWAPMTIRSTNLSMLSLGENDADCSVSVMVVDEGLLITLECFEENIPDLPDSFGGKSGGGLWRVYARKREDGSFETVYHRLIGIASSEDKGTPPRIACQGIGRIDMMLEGVRRQMSGKG